MPLRLKAGRLMVLLVRVIVFIGTGCESSNDDYNRALVERIDKAKSSSVVVSDVGIEIACPTGDRSALPRFSDMKKADTEMIDNILTVAYMECESAARQVANLINEATKAGIKDVPADLREVRRQLCPQLMQRLPAFGKIRGCPQFPLASLVAI